jgi:hypothetical protein
MEIDVAPMGQMCVHHRLTTPARVARWRRDRHRRFPHPFPNKENGAYPRVPASPLVITREKRLHKPKTSPFVIAVHVH